MICDWASWLQLDFSIKHHFRFNGVFSVVANSFDEISKYFLQSFARDALCSKAIYVNCWLLAHAAKHTANAMWKRIFRPEIVSKLIQTVGNKTRNVSLTSCHLSEMQL